MPRPVWPGFQTVGPGKIEIGPSDCKPLIGLIHRVSALGGDSSLDTPQFTGGFTGLRSTF